MTNESLSQKLIIDTVRIINSCKLSIWEDQKSWVEQEQLVCKDYQERNFKKYYSLIDHYLSQTKTRSILPTVYIKNVSELLKIWERAKTGSVKFPEVTSEEDILKSHGIDLKSLNSQLEKLTRVDKVIIPYSLVELWGTKKIEEYISVNYNCTGYVHILPLPSESSTRREKVNFYNKTTWVYYPIMPLAVVSCVK